MEKPKEIFAREWNKFKPWIFFAYDKELKEGDTKYIRADIAGQQIKELKEKSEAVHNGTVLPLKQQIKELREYATHHITCPLHHDEEDENGCYCGLDELLNK